jgi:hypothetical protein
MCGSLVFLTNLAKATENAPGSHGEPLARTKTQRSSVYVIPDA